jgi:hypothetical protein
MISIRFMDCCISVISTTVVVDCCHNDDDNEDVLVSSKFSLLHYCYWMIVLSLYLWLYSLFVSIFLSLYLCKRLRLVSNPSLPSTKKTHTHTNTHSPTTPTLKKHTNKTQKKHPDPWQTRKVYSFQSTSWTYISIITLLICIKIKLRQCMNQDSA